MSIWSALIAPVANTITSLNENKTKVKLRKGELLDSRDERNHTWELAALAGDGWEEPIIRLAIYCEVLFLVVIAIVDPDYAKEVYTAINPVFSVSGNQIGGIPPWITGLHLTIAGWGFGSQPIKAMGAGLVVSLIKFPGKS